MSENSSLKSKATIQKVPADAAPELSVKSVLVIDVGGNSVKILATGQTEARAFQSGPTLTPRQMVSGVKKLAADWSTTWCLSVILVRS
jgi:polyphosphate glucokinase